MANTEATQIFVHIEHSTYRERKYPCSFHSPSLPTASPVQNSLPQPSKTRLRMVLGGDADGPVRNVWDVASQ